MVKVIRRTGFPASTKAARTFPVAVGFAREVSVYSKITS